MLKKGLLIELFTLLSFGISSGAPPSQTKATELDPIWVPCITCPCYCYIYCNDQYDDPQLIGVCVDACLYGCAHG